MGELSKPDFGVSVDSVDSLTDEQRAQRVSPTIRFSVGEPPRTDETRELSPEVRAKLILRALSPENQNEWLASIGVGVRHRDLDIDDSLIPKECEFWTTAWGNGASMVLAGNVGSGKTVAAVWCLRKIYEEGERYYAPTGSWSWRPPSVLFTKARDLYRAVFARNEAFLARCRDRKVLVIDEWGGAYDTEWPLTEMDGIIDTRWERRLATIVTTNLQPTKGDTSMKATTPRALDRLCDEPGPGLVVIDRPSLRTNTQKGG